MNPSRLTPRSQGYRMPAEWFPHESTWLAWPKNSDTWPDRLDQIQKICLRVISLLCPGERCDLLVDDAEREALVRHRLDSLDVDPGRIVLHQIKTADAWIRDYGPNFLLRQDQQETQLAFNHWAFDAWGHKYRELAVDAVVPEKLEPVLKVRKFVPGRVLEGGAIDVNGEGACLASECLLRADRNPGCSRSDMEKCLRGYLGVEQITWVGGLIKGDDTDGHVDNLARFVDSRTILCSVEKDPADENHQPLLENLQRLQSTRDWAGRPFEVISLPMPGPIEGPAGRLPATYVNFYIANAVVLVPVFSDSNDARALGTLERLFPDRKVFGLDCRDVVRGLGSLHCLTQQQPATQPIIES